MTSQNRSSGNTGRLKWWPLHGCKSLQATAQSTPKDLCPSSLNVHIAAHSDNLKHSHFHVAELLSQQVGLRA